MKSLKFAVPLLLAFLAVGSIRAAEKEEKVVGTVEKAPADAKAGVVAILKVDDKTTLNLVATGEVAEAVKKEIGKKAEVTGTKDGTTLKVTAIKAAAAAPGGAAK